MTNKQQEKTKSNLKECFNYLSSLGLNKEDREKLKAVGVNDSNLTYDMLIAYNVMEKAKTGDAKAIKVYMELTDQDKETQLKEKDLQLKEYAINLNEYKACGSSLFDKGEFNAYRREYIQNRENGAYND